ncbi:DUF4347 domain-containing protein, partial [Pectobacterium sp. B1J-3]|uniref:DUF4347 domain-containing protein n=1 Tax=Pectobacterium sp. B1J-3 TaxID=3385371 RepID=UPI0039057901
MLWRQLFSKKSDRPTDHIEQAYSAPLGCVLESRVLFDGAIAATATQTETANSSDATASSHPAQTANHSAEAASENSTSSEQNNATHDITTDVVVQAVAGETTRKEAVFIDTAVTDYQTLIDNVPAGVDVFLLDSSKDGLNQLAAWAETHRGYDAIHILSHGSEGQIRLGNLTLDSATAEARSADLAKLGTALTQDGDLLLYGCDIAQDTGKSFVSLLSQLTQADIAASDDLTGATAKGGNWQLETTVGSIETNNAALGEITQEYNNLLASPTLGTNTFSQFSGTTTFVSSQPGLQSYDDISNGFTYVAFSTDKVSLQTATVSGNQVLNTIVTPGGDLNYFAFKSTDGSEFKLSSIDLRGLGNYASTFTITGYKDGSAVAGVTQTITLTIPFQTVTLSNAFQGIDEVRLTTTTIGNGTVTWDNIVTAPLASTDNVPSIVGSATNPTYTENGAAVGLFTGVSVNTNDSGQTFTGATLTISNVAGNTEYLTLHGINVALSHGNSVSLGSGYGSASVSLSGGIATVSITGAALSNSDMGNLLSGMTYGNSSDNPGNATRTVTLTQLTDSGSSNNTVAPNISSAITVVPVNDAPTDLALSNTTFGQSLGSNGTVATLTATDVDSSVFTYSLVSGSGSTDNALFTISGNTLKAVNAATMAAGTYSVRLQVSDGQATYEKVVTLTVADDIAPTFDATPTITSPTTGGFTLNTDLNERGTIYYVVLPDGASAPSVTQIINGQNASGSLPFASGSQVSNSPPYSQSLTVTGLAAATAYDVYVVARDNAGNATISAIKVDVTTTSTTNTAPVFSNLNGGATYTENGSAVVIDNNVTVADTELDALNSGLGNYNGASITIARNGGASSNDIFGNSGLLGALTQGQNFTYNGTAMGSVTTNSNGTLALTFNSNATSAIVDAVLQSLTYANSSDNPPTSVTLNWTFNDGSLNSVGSNQTVLSITPVNDAPTLSSGATVTLVTTTEDITSSSTAISSLLSAAGYADVDNGAVSGIALTALTGNGTWQYSTDSGANWFNVGTVSDSSALLLSSSARIRYVPDGANGETAALGFRAWDQTSGTATAGASKGLADTSIVGGSSAFSINSAQAGLTVSNVNDAPTLSSGATVTLTTTTEDVTSSSTSISSLLSAAGYADVDNGAVSGIALTALTGNGTWQYSTNSGANWFSVGTVSSSSALLLSSTAQIRYVPDGANGETAALGFRAWDQTSGTATSGATRGLADTSTTGGSSAFSTNSAQASLAVTDVNDAPTVGSTVSGQSATEDAAFSFTMPSGTFVDVDSGDTLTLSASQADGSALPGWLSFNPATGTFSGTPASGDVGSLTIKVTATDSNTASVSTTFELTVTNVNDAPEVSGTIPAQSIAQGGSLNVTIPAGTFTDPDGDTLMLSASQADGTALPSWLTFNPATGTFSGTPANGDVGNLIIRVTASDGDASVSTTFELTVTNVNDAPEVSGTIPAQSIAQGGSLNFTVPAGTFTDPDGDTLTLSASRSDGTALPSWLTFNATTG